MDHSTPGNISASRILAIEPKVILPLSVTPNEGNATWHRHHSSFREAPSVNVDVLVTRSVFLPRVRNAPCVLVPRQRLPATCPATLACVQPRMKRHASDVDLSDNHVAYRAAPPQTEKTPSLSLACTHLHILTQMLRALFVDSASGHRMCFHLPWDDPSSHSGNLLWRAPLAWTLRRPSVRLLRFSPCLFPVATR